MTIAEIMKLPPGTPVPVACGMVKGVGPRASGDNPAPWSLQNIFIGDATESIPVKIGNHDEIPQSVVGTVLYFVAHKKPTGGLSGLKVDLDRQMEGGKPKEWPVLAVARSGEIMSEEDWQKKNAPAAAPAPAAPVQQTAVPVQQTAVPVGQIAQPTKQAAAAQMTAEPQPCRNNSFKELRYERTVNTGNYCSEKLGVTIAVGSDENPEQAFQSAKQFLATHLPPEFIPDKGARKV
ncbi:MAG: hypothetical protein WC378_19730 [Opitutaceae bacterium]